MLLHIVRQFVLLRKEVGLQYTDISAAEFEAKINHFKTNLDNLFAESKTLEKEIQKQLNGLKYE